MDWDVGKLLGALAIMIGAWVIVKLIDLWYAGHKRRIAEYKARSARSAEIMKTWPPEQRAAHTAHNFGINAIRPEKAAKRGNPMGIPPLSSGARAAHFNADGDHPRR